MKGHIVKVHTDDHGGWVPAIVNTDPDDDGKVWVTAFPGPAKDSENLQEPASALLSAPGTGKYEHQPL